MPGCAELSVQARLRYFAEQVFVCIAANVGGWNGSDLEILWVEKPYRNRGLGSYLLGEIEREAIRNGAYKLFASTGDWNVGFFKKNGYFVSGELKDVPRGHNCYELEKPI